MIKLDDESDKATVPVRRSWWQTLLRGLVELLIYIVIAVVVVSLIRVFLIQPFLVPSESMQNTLQKGDRILAWKPGEPQRGEIIVFRDDLDWLPPGVEAPAWKRGLAWIKVLPPQDEQYLVKRLIGLPGDHVVCCDANGALTINGTVLDESAYFFGNHLNSEIPFDIIVPAGRFFVLGDHRDASSDSRFHMCDSNRNPTPEIAFPQLSAIQGSVFAVMAPLSRAQTFKIPAAFDQIPPATATPPLPGQEQWTCD